MSDSVPRVSIIIPHYNQKECLQRLLPGLDRQTFRDFEVIIIDDRTPDEDTVRFIQDFARERPNTHLVRNSENMRFIKSVNRGIRLAKGEYVCLLNSDVDVAANFVESNVKIVESDITIGGLSCVIVDAHGRNWFSGGFYKNGFPVNASEDFQGLRTVDFVAGTAAFYRKEVFDKIGLFDENYGMYHEDVEFGLRLQARSRYRVCTFSDKLVTHYSIPSIPTGELLYFLNRNLVLLAKTYSPRSVPRIVLLHMPREAIFKIAASVLRLKPTYAWTSIDVIRGTLDGLRLKPSC